MASELPYYKFEVLSYLTGDICLERFELQGIFNNICAFYWSKNCDLTLVTLFKKYDGYKELILELIELDILKVDNEHLSIKFLNEQWASKETQKIVNTINGKKGGRPKKENQNQTEIKPNGLFFANPNVTNIKESKEKERKEDDIIDNSKISSILDFFDFSIDNPNHHNQQRMVLAFLKVYPDTDYFFKQFEAYKKIKTKEPQYKHSINSFLGTQSEEFKDGKWLDTVWTEKLKIINIGTKQVEPTFSLAERNRQKRIAEELKNKTQ